MRVLANVGSVSRDGELRVSDRGGLFPRQGRDVLVATHVGFLPILWE